MQRLDQCRLRVCTHNFLSFPSFIDCPSQFYSSCQIGCIQNTRKLNNDAKNCVRRFVFLRATPKGKTRRNKNDLVAGTTGKNQPSNIKLSPPLFPLQTKLQKKLQIDRQTVFLHPRFPYKHPKQTDR